MLAIVLALGAALGWGVSDFLGGLRSRVVPLVWVMLISQVAALVVLAGAVTWRGTSPPDPAFLVLAGAAGVSEMVGIAALYRGLAVGTMSVVAPAAATAPVIPLLAGLAAGEVPGPVQGAGMALATIGIVVTARRPDTAAASRTGRSVLYGLLAALGFGGFFTAMDAASEGDVGWSLLLARTAAVAVIATIAVVRRPGMAVRGTDLPAIVVIGVLVVAADSMYATASTLGMLGVVAVLGTLHTVVTIGLARVFLNERLARLQQIGVAVTLAGVLAISA